MPVLEERLIEGDESLLQSFVGSPLRSHPRDRRRCGRRAFFHSAWVGVATYMLRLGDKIHDGACRQASLVLGLEA